jgi:hypothetical protein
MGQSTFRRRGTGSSRPGVEQSDGSPVDSGRPGTSVVGACVLVVSMLGLPVAIGALSMGDMVAYAAGGAALAAAGSGMIFVGVRRRLW